MRSCLIKWFKHDSAASLDAKLARVRLKYGMEGYGLYWFCLESIARNVETHNLTFELEEDAELLSAATGIHYERVQDMMTYMANLGLFENCDGRITCLKMASRTDEYTQKLLRSTSTIPTLSRHAPDKVPPIRTEENRTEEKRINKKPPVADAPVLPDYIHLESWNEWTEYRRQAKKKLTPTTVAKQHKFLSEYDKPTQAVIINQSITNGWTGLFEPKGATNGNTKNIINGSENSRRLSPGDRTRQLREQRFAERAATGTPDMGCVGDNA